MRDNRPDNWQIFSLGQSIERLPLTAKRKYRALMALVEDSEALTRTSFAREKLLEDRVTALRQQSVDLRDIEAVAEQQSEIAELASELEQLNRERGRRRSITSNAEQVLSQLDSVIPTLAGRGLRAVPADTDQLPADLTDAIIRVRTDIGAAKVEVQQLRTAPLPSDEIKERLTEQIDRLASQGVPSLDLANGKVEIRWPDETKFANTGATISAPPLGATKLLAWMFHDQLVEALTAGLDDMQGGVTLAEREQRIGELEVSILDLERQEEALVEAALAAGLECHRRPTADPLAILGVEIIDATNEMDAEMIGEAAA